MRSIPFPRNSRLVLITSITPDLLSKRMEIANASVSPAIHIARALGVLSIEASLATSLACSLRWSTSCLTSAEELAGSQICVASASCCNSGMLGGLCARPYRAPKI